MAAAVAAAAFFQLSEGREGAGLDGLDGLDGNDVRAGVAGESGRGGEAGGETASPRRCTSNPAPGGAVAAASVRASVLPSSSLVA